MSGNAPSGKPIGGPRVTVVKLGGSLEPYLTRLLPVLQSSPRPLLIVPGGGQFADAIRHSPAADDPDAAHWMAVAAMEQYGWLISSQGIPATDHLISPARTSVFLPYRAMREYDPLPHSWDVTSDTIAAWVARLVGGDLLVLKSIDGLTAGGKLIAHLHAPVETEIVDPWFLTYVFEHHIRTFILNGTLPGRVEKWLAGKQVPGTGIGTTF
ncbi:MAG: uridylate kinase [Methanoregula sp.]|nr:uridylate kinase [Methanoregula sp.]